MDQAIFTTFTLAEHYGTCCFDDELELRSSGKTQDGVLQTLMQVWPEMVSGLVSEI